MSRARLFVPQETLEIWLSEGRAHMVGESMFMKGQSFELESAVRFTEEVSGGLDEAKLVGCVKTLPELAALGGEHCAASVVLGDNAYEVVEGFLARPDVQGTQPAGTHDRLIRLFTQP